MTTENQHSEQTEQEVESQGELSRRKFMKNMGEAMLNGGLLAGLPFGGKAKAAEKGTSASSASAFSAPRVDRVAADPRDIPGPITRNRPVTHDITLESKDVISEIEPGVDFKFMTYGGQVPGPMIRVRRGDSINLTFKNNSQNTLLHNVDFHAVYGTGGGAEATLCPPRYKPGSYISS